MRCADVISKASALMLCIFLLGGCSLVRKVLPQPEPVAIPAPSAPDKSERVVITDTTPVKPTAPEKIEKPSEEIVAKPLTKEDKSTQNRIIRIAKGKLGSRYQSAGKGPNHFDCSGFTGYVFKQVGISLGASSRDQFLQGRPIAKGEPLRRGDLVFWNGRRVGNTVGHVGIVVDYDESTDSFTFIHAAVSTGVELQKSTAEYYARRYMGARRILEEIPVDSPEEPETEESAKNAGQETAAAPQTQPETPAQPEPVYHTIKSGDTLSALAVKYHTSVSKICSLNGITSKTILKIGRKLRIK